MRLHEPIEGMTPLKKFSRYVEGAVVIALYVG